MENVRVMGDTEIRVKGMEALYESLGVAGALRFLSLLHREPTNYVDVSKRLYQEQTIDEIFARAGQNWQGSLIDNG
ncbi:MAG: hypothetical protein F6K17_04050 [Okeania sp. SIO3C4]|nr:hypothetical protein [Okeania sp. SIO3C4]